MPNELLFPLILSGTSLIILFLLRGIAFHNLHRWAKQSQTTIDDVLIQQVRLPSLLVCFIIPLYFLIWRLKLPQEITDKLIPLFSVILIVCLATAIAGVLGILFRYYTEKMSFQVSTAGIIPSTIKAGIFLFAGLLILQTIGIKIGPMIAGLGIFGTGVIFVLRDALANLAAGFYVLMDKPIRIGDYIKIASEEEGCVIDIGWRAIRIKTPANNILIVPNSKLVTASITNFNLLETKMSLAIPVLVKYGTDPEMVERVLLETANEARNTVSGISKEDSPVVRLKNFGEFGLEFTLNCSIERYDEQGRIGHELRKHILAVFQREGIEMVVQ